MGESGSGKSVTTLSILGLLPQPPGRIAGGTAMFKGEDLLKMKKRELRSLRGEELAMIFQDPMTSLNPVLKVGVPARGGDQGAPPEGAGRKGQTSA